MVKTKSLACLFAAAVVTAANADDEPAWQWVEETRGVIESQVTGLGRTRFPDGGDGAWVGTVDGVFREIDGRWDVWPDIDTMPTGKVFDVLIAPDASGLTAWWLATDSGLLVSRSGRDWEHWTPDNSGLPHREVRALVLTQSGADRPEVWVATRGGLARWEGGDWKTVLARPDGFFGGDVHTAITIDGEGAESAWFAGPDGVSRWHGGRWQRHGRECLRGRNVVDLVVRPDSSGPRPVAVTEHGIALLDPADAGSCRWLELFPQGAGASIRHAGSDGAGGTLFYTADKILWAPSDDALEDLRPRAFFDHRDGLSSLPDAAGGTLERDSGAIRVGSAHGLWTFRAAAVAGAVEPQIHLVIEDRAAPLDAGEHARLGASSVRLRPGATGLARAHAASYRVTVGAEEVVSDLRAGESVEVPVPRFGAREVRVELFDGRGERFGPATFGLARDSWVTILGLVAGALLGLALLAVWMLRGRNASATQRQGRSQ